MLYCQQVHDAADLGEWVHRMRAARKRGTLPPAQQAALDALGFAWEVDVVTAKWYHNLHAARHYRVGQGSIERGNALPACIPLAGMPHPAVLVAPAPATSMLDVMQSPPACCRHVVLQQA